MAKPAILCVDDEPEVLRAVERDLRGRYRSDYSRNDPYHWGISTDLVSDLNGGHPKLNDVVPLNGYLLVLESNDFMPNPQPSAIIGENRLHVIIGKW